METRFTPPRAFRAAACAALAALALSSAPAARSQSLAPPPSTGPVLTVPAFDPPLRYLPHLSMPRAQYYQNNPAAWKQLLSTLPRRTSVAATAETPRPASAFGGTWQLVNNFLPFGFACNPLLLTDGTVLVADCGTANWLRLTPDNSGSYVNGTWTSTATMPMINGIQYAPLYFASAVLPDGRVIVEGGEYNTNGGVQKGDHTNMGAIYDPVADTWTAVAPPTGGVPPTAGGGAWFAIGDAQSTVLGNGTFLLAACCGGSPTADALFDAANLTWSATGGPSNSYSYQDEQGYSLLPNGNVLTIDLWDDYPSGNTTNAEQYVPATGTWVSAGNTPVELGDPYQCGNWEIGPAAMRPDGTLVAFGGNTGCAAAPSATDPTAIYTPGSSSTAGTWRAGPNVPALCGAGGTTSCTLADAPAAVLPNGNVLFAASSGYSQAPTHFFEFTGASSTSPNTINQVADPIYFSGTSGSGAFDFLVLPTGQIFSADSSNAPEIYTPVGNANPSWAPVISSAPTAVKAGGAVYPISGTQFNGLTQGAYFGDDVQASSNYPLVQFTMSATGHVFYGRTFNHSTMSIAPGTAGSTNFTVPTTIESGPSNLVVIANGIASNKVPVTLEFASTVFPPDFTGDGKSDLLWRNSSGDVATWFMNGSTISSSADFGTVPLSWTIQGTGDFNGNGKSDILWRNSSGDVVIWFLNGGKITSSADLGIISSNWTIVGKGDFNGDGKTDILWQDSGGDVVVWFMNGGTIVSSGNLGTIPSSWTIKEIADFNGDGKSDILWRNSTGDVVVWLMNGATIASSSDLGVVPLSWTIQGACDFTGKGKSDILWRNSNGDVDIWVMNGGSIASSADLGVIPLSYSIIGTGDFNADGKCDILWQDSSGDVLTWFMNGTTIASSASLGVVPAAWTLVQ